MSLFKISPSDLTFAWEECKHCFYMRVRHNIVLRSPFPGMFGKMANLTSEFYQGKSSAEISPDLPAGVIKYREKFVKSAPISLPGVASQCYINGRFDAVIEFEDGTFGIIDYKTSEARDEHAEFYCRQLTAYAYALENPAPNALRLSPVSRMGLFIITPNSFERAAEKTVFVNQATWMDVLRDDIAFLGLLGDVVRLLDAPEPPPPSATCPVCTYRANLEEFERLSAEAPPRLPGL